MYFVQEYRNLFLENGWEIVSITDKHLKSDSETLKNSRIDKKIERIKINQTRARFSLKCVMSSPYEDGLHYGQMRILDLSTGKICAGIIFQVFTRGMVLKELFKEINKNIIVR